MKTQKINNTILRFNAVKHLLQNKTAFDNADESKIKSFVELIQQSESNCSRAPEVKVKENNIPIPAGKIMHGDCKLNMGLVKKERAMIFHSKCVELPKGIQCADSDIMLKPGIRNSFKAPLINQSNHNTKIMKNTVIGNLKNVTSVVPLEVHANTYDPTRTENSAINKVEVVKANEPAADSKEVNASGKDDHFQKVLENIDLSGLTHEQREQVRKMVRKKAQLSLLTMMT